MDYNDYEGHNLNLAGEESSKSSSALRPFSIPKYDFDDSLHAHLKYDSLVENEVFLGIPSQDDNQWIEDYSRGSSGAVFSSSATEHCALPGCNNIWSEATSSESVEMLLKAVGQEEAIPGESMVDESDPVNQQGPLTGQMGSKLREACNPLLHPSDMDVDYIDTSSKKRIGESDEQDKASHISFVTSSYPSKGISVELAEKQELFNANDEMLSGNAVEEFDSEIQSSTEIPPEREFLKEEFAVETVNLDMQCSHQIPPEMVSLREEFPVETVNLEMQFSLEILPEDESREFAVKKLTELAANGPEKGESVSTAGECSEIAVSAETVGGNECGGAVFSSSSVSMLHEVPGVASQGEKCTEEFGIKGDDVTEPLVDQPMRPVGVAGICPERNNSLEATFEDSTLAGVVSDISEQDHKSNMDDANGNSMDSSVGGEFCVEKSASEIREARRDVVSQKESLENVGEGDQEVSPSEGVVSDNNGKEGVSNFPFEGGNIQAEKVAGSPGNQGIEGEHTKVTSSRVEHDGLVSCTEQMTILFTKEQMSRDAHLDASTGPSTSVPNDFLEVAAEIAPSTGIKNSTPPVSVAAGGTEPPYLVDTCDVAMRDEVLNEKTGNPASDLIVQNDISKASPSGMLEVGGTAETNSYITSGNNVAGESAESKQVLAPSEGEKTFTFDIRPLEVQSAVDSVKGLQSSPIIKACVLSLTEDASPVTPCGTQKDKVVTKGKSRRSSSTPSSGGQPSEGIVGPSGPKTRRGSSKGNPPKDKASSRNTPRVSKSSTPSSPLVIGQLMTFESAVRPTSSTSDLNTSTPPPPVFLPPSAGLQQPYTDSQQLQLRAQILVYGSLIQGTAPEESCMVAAFSLPDGDKSVWESSLKTCRERIRTQNQGVNMETPFQSRGALTASQTARKGSTRSEQVGPSQSPIPSPSFNQIIPMSSPLWSMSTPSLGRPQTSSFPRSSMFDYRAISPLNPYQTPPLRNFVAPTTSWSSQAPVAVPLFTSPLSSPLNTEPVGVTYSAFPNNEPVKITPTKESTVPISSGARSPVPWFAPPLSSLNTEPVAGVTYSSFPNNEPVNLTATKESTSQISSGAQPPVDAKTRKRKKSSTSVVDTAPASPSNAFTPKVSAMGFPGLIPQTQAASTPTPVVSYHNSTSVVIPPPPSFIPKGTPNQSREGGDLFLGKRTLHMESIKKVDEAKLEAEEASAHANLAVSQCEYVWGRLVEKSSSGLTSDTEAMLASASVAIAAAASVAKAAAAAAKVASSVALQAKQMVDEAISKRGSETPVVSIFMSAAREAARKRVEAASTATKNAENLDAIVKAAELAAEAVSHTGKIVGMGDPFSLDQLMKYGPDGYWKTNETNQTDNVREVLPVTMDLEEGSDKNVPTAGEATPPLKNDAPINVDEDRLTGFKEGSIVEVLRDIGDSKKAWFSAKILRLKDGAALVNYTELQSEGSRLPNEWVPLEAQGGKAPVLRFPYPIISGNCDGTRKRNRAAARDYAVGDRAEAYVKDCWREAIVVEKNKIDPTSLIVSFPGGGESKLVKVWQLRPIFIWSDGQWMEISTTVENAASQGDMPVEKRQKLGDKDVEAKIMGKRVIDFFAEKGAESSNLPLADKDNVFSIGSTKDENPNMVRTKRSGLQKGGSNVVYGVPKPTKKFMDMSKHYVAEKTLRQPEPNGAATKLSKNTIQQGSSSRGFRSYTNPDVQEKETSESKGKAVRTPRPQIVPGSTAGPTMVFASQSLRPDNKKKALSRNAGPERMNRGKVISSGKMPKTPARIVNSIPEPSEPRRSVRRIQPTSRLLEGIQSSLIMPNMHAKTEKNIHKGSSSRGSESRD